MRRFQRAGLAAQAAALVSGAALPLSLAPVSWWPIAPLALAVLLVTCLKGTATQAAWRGWLFGLGAFGTGTSWIFVSIHRYGDAPVPLAAGLTFLFCAGLALFTAFGMWAWARLLRPRRGGVLLGFPAMWVLVEWSREWVLTGFPWLLSGYSQTDGPLAGWAPVVGVYGIGLLLAFSAAASVWLLSRPAPGEPLARGATLALVAALWVAAWPLARIEWSTPSGTPLSVALVQGNIPQLLKWEPDHLENTLGIYAGLSEPVWGSDLVVWPESSVPAYFDTVTDFLSTQAARAASSGSTLLLGLPSRQEDPAQKRGYVAYNSVAALGSETGVYHKRHLVPFGEYVPLESALRGLIAFFDLPMSSFTEGPAEQTLLAGAGTTIAPSICYEIVYPELVRRGAAGAGLLLTVSNDTWFGASLGPLQHLEMARMRALENSRDLLRATNDGVSALIDHRGTVTVRGGQFSREVVRGEVQPRTGSTPYTQLGYWPVMALCVLMLLAVLARPGAASPEDG